MAATLALTAATPFTLKYNYVYDAAASGTIDRTQAQLIADLAGIAGPLRPLLASITTDGAWEALDGSPLISIYFTSNTAAASVPVGAEFAATIGGRVLRVACQDGNANRGTVEIRYHHTFNR